jgi:endonuclease III
MKLADDIRRYTRSHMVQPCRDAGVSGFSIRAGDVHSAMGLQSRVPSVCAALRSRKFQEENDIELLQVEGPDKGSTTTFHFRFRHAGAGPPPEARPRQESSASPSETPARALDPPFADRVFLVSCVSSKRDAPAPARELYTSDWFRKARVCVEATGSPWFILSAEYGLVHPDAVIEPYERTLNRMAVTDRRAWARRVREQMDRMLPACEEIVVLAGERYRELLLEDLRGRAPRVSVPMAGMRIGEQLRWLGEQLPDREEPVPVSGSGQPGPRVPGAAVVQRLLELDGQIDRAVFFPTLEPEAARFVLDDAYAFLLATCLDRGTRAEIIWTIPWWLREQWGHLDARRVRSLDAGTILDALQSMPRRPRYLSAAPETIMALTRIVVDEYGGDARALWRGRTPVDFRETLRRVPGVGPGIASMAVQLVDRAFPGEMEESTSESLDIKADVHTRRVLYRLGFAEDASDGAAVRAARRLNPDHPGVLDGPLWYAGRVWCYPDEPDCPACYLASVCSQRGVTATSHDATTLAPVDRVSAGTSGRSGKYAPLSEYLAARHAVDARITMAFGEIEALLGGSLPASATRYRTWWNNHGGAAMSPQGQAWLEAGYRVESVDPEGKRVTFVRAADR